jgi:excisionase family DNA binding protein
MPLRSSMLFTALLRMLSYGILSQLRGGRGRTSLMEEVLTVHEVARYLRVHPMTVQRWCRTGDLPAAKIGRAYRIKKDDLDEWWAQHSPADQSLQVPDHDDERT